MDTLNLFIFLIIINIISHLILFWANNYKNDFSVPLIFKIFIYSTILGLNILVVSLLLFSQDILNDKNVYVYIIITLVLFIVHFLFDEDVLFRFEKVVGFILSSLLTFVFYSGYIWIVL